MCTLAEQDGPAILPVFWLRCPTLTALRTFQRGAVAFGRLPYSSRLRSSSRWGFSSRNIGFRCIPARPYRLELRRLKSRTSQSTGSALWWLLIAIPTVRHLGPRRRITQPMLSQPVNPVARGQEHSFESQANTRDVWLIAIIRRVCRNRQNENSVQSSCPSGLRRPDAHAMDC
jgi:hypothetical protein